MVRLLEYTPRLRECSARLEHPQARFECGLRAKRLDRHVNAASLSEPHDFNDRVAAQTIDHVIGTDTARNLKLCRKLVHANDYRGAAEFRATSCRQPDRALHNTATVSPMRISPRK